MTRKYDWQKLQDEFVRGDWLSLRQFFKEKRVPYSSYTRSRAKGWLKEKRDYQRLVIKKARKKVLEDEVELKVRQTRLAKAMQAKGIKELVDLEVKKADDARKLVVDGMREERRLLGLTDKEIPESLTQVNVSFPRTKFDEMIERMDYRELLEFAAELKRERVRRMEFKEVGVTNSNMTIR